MPYTKKDPMTSYMTVCNNCTKTTTEIALSTSLGEDIPPPVADYHTELSAANTSIIIGVISAVLILIAAVGASLAVIKARRKNSTLTRRPQKLELCSPGPVRSNRHSLKSVSADVHMKDSNHNLRNRVINGDDHYLSVENLPAYKGFDYFDDISCEAYASNIHLQPRASSNPSKVLSLPPNVYNEKTQSAIIMPDRTLTQHFHRGTGSRRSRSYDNLKNQDFMRSIDSGFCSTSVMSVSTSPGSRNDAIISEPVTKVDSRYSLLMHSCAYKDRASLRNFLTKGSYTTGETFDTDFITIGVLDQNGGNLEMKSDKNIRLVLPPGALQAQQLIYIILQADVEDDPNCENYSPVFECGPDGLHFKKPVHLTFPHCAVDVDLRAMTRPNTRSGWVEDMADDGAQIVNATSSLVTLAINHFTGYKVAGIQEGAGIQGAGQSSGSGMSRSCRSRIPLRMKNSGQAKKLVLNVYHKDDRVRVYVVPGNQKAFTHEVDGNERGMGFAPVQPMWGEFKFKKGQGDLIISGTDQEEKTRVFEPPPIAELRILGLQTPMTLHYISNKEMILNLNIHQTNDPHFYSQFSARLLTSTVRSMLPSDQHNSSPHTKGHVHRNSAAEEGAVGGYPLSVTCRSISDGEAHHRRISERTPQEHCMSDCEVWAGGHRYGEEHTEEFMEENGELCLSRWDPNRKSKESGYESAIMSPAGPLRGPDSMGDFDIMLPSSIGTMLSSLNLDVQYNYLPRRSDV